MSTEPPGRKPNPIIQKIEESKKVKTNDQPRLKPTYAPSGPGLSPMGSVGIVQTPRAYKIDQRREKRADEIGTSLKDVFNERSRNNKF